MNARSGWLGFARVGLALAFGFMAGSLEAMTRDAEGLRFHVGLWTVIAFLVGAALGWFYWEMAVRMSSDSSARAKRRFVIFTALMFVAAFASYLYRLRFAPGTSAGEVAQGVVLAFVVVGGIAVVMWRIVRFLEGK